MSSIINRIEEIIFDKRLNDSKFEGITGKSSGYLNTLRKSSKRYPGADFIISIIERFPEYSLNWLLLGEGPKLKAETNQVNETQSEYILESNILLKHLDHYVRTIVKDEIKEPISELNEHVLVLMKRQVNSKEANDFHQNNNKKGKG